MTPSGHKSQYCVVAGLMLGIICIQNNIIQHIGSNTATFPYIFFKGEDKAQRKKVVISAFREMMMMMGQLEYRILYHT